MHLTKITDALSPLNEFQRKGIHQMESKQVFPLCCFQLLRKKKKNNQLEKFLKKQGK